MHSEFPDPINEYKSASCHLFLVLFCRPPWLSGSAWMVDECKSASCLFFSDQKSSDRVVGWRRIMVTCAPKFTFIEQKGTYFPNLGTQNSNVTFFSWNNAFKGHKKAQKITTALLKGQLPLFFWGKKYEDVIDVIKKQNDDLLLKMCTNSTTFQALLTKGTKKGRSIIIHGKAVFFCFRVIKLTCRTFRSLSLAWPIRRRRKTDRC